MAKSDSFFLRASILVDDSATYDQVEINLGSYVDALGKSVLRIHNMSYEVTDDSGLAPNMDAGKSGSVTFQLVTQSQTSIVTLADKAVIAKGMIWCRNTDGSNSAPPAESFSEDVTPQIFTNGYLVATENIFLGASADTNWAGTANLTVSILLECTVETMSQSAAMALALSQQ